jgi:hypothetical protein
MSGDDAVLLTAATLLAHTLAKSGREDATAEEIQLAVTLALRNGEKLFNELDKRRDEQSRKAMEQGWVGQGPKQEAERTKKS